MNIGLFGGSFDPVHRGHLSLAQAAASRYSMRQVLFVAGNVPPHKQKQPVTPFVHRYAMVALAIQDEKQFVPSLLEAPAELNTSGAGKGKNPASNAVNYSIDTVRRLKASLKQSDRLFFLIGIDAFRDIAKWREAQALLAECEFVVASRPGYSLRDVAEALPESSTSFPRCHSSVPQATGDRRPGPARSHAAFAGGRSPERVGHRNPRSRRTRQTSSQMARSAGGRLH